MADETWILVNVVVVGAAMLQAATGIGFGMLAGPVFLMVMDKGVAIQLSIILNLVIALALAPRLMTLIDKPLLGRFLIGGIAGLPLGVVIFNWLDVAYLKGFAGLAVLFMALILAGVFSARPAIAGEKGSGIMDAVAGVVSGLMSTSLAMPGPAAAAWMSFKGQRKDVIRGTVLALFVVSYGAALLMQGMTVGVASATYWTALDLLPATFGGIMIGHVMARYINEVNFKRIVATALLSTALSLLASLTGII